MPSVHSDNLEDGGRVISALRKTEEDILRMSRLIAEVGHREAYLQVYGVDRPEFEEGSEFMNAQLERLKQQFQGIGTNL